MLPRSRIGLVSFAGRMHDNRTAVELRRQPQRTTRIRLDPPAVHLGKPDRAGPGNPQFQPALAKTQIGARPAGCADRARA